MESILTSIKKLIGLTEDYTQFDMDIIVHINAAFFTLNQLGVGPSSGYSIIDKDNKWDEFKIAASMDDSTIINAIKPYIYLKVRKVFDPPSSSAIMESITQSIAEYESRLMYSCDK